MAVRFLRDEDGQPLGLHGISRDITERRRLDVTIKTVLESTRQQYGEGFFVSVVKNIAEVLEVKYIYIGVVVDEKTFRTLAVCKDGKIIENFEYKLEGTPCEKVFNDENCFYRSKVQSLFPMDDLLVELEIESYLGVRMSDSEGEIMGMMICMDDKFMRDDPLAENLVGIVASHVAAELQRRRSEDEKHSFNNSCSNLRDSTP